MFGQPASFPSLFSQAQNLPGTHECALPSTQPIFSAQLEPSVSMMDYFMEVSSDLCLTEMCVVFRVINFYFKTSLFKSLMAYLFHHFRQQTLKL